MFAAFVRSRSVAIPLLWSRLFLKIRIGHGLARIARVLWGKAPCGAGIECPRLARRVVAPHGRGRKWRERPPLFDRWCGTGQGEMVHAKIHHLPSPSGVAPSTVIPGGKPPGALSRSGRMSVLPCSFVTCLLLYVLWCVLCCAVSHFISASLPKPVNGASSSAPSGTSTSAPGCAPSSMRPSTASSVALPPARTSWPRRSRPRLPNPSLNGPRPG